jgi:hypothetical protein
MVLQLGFWFAIFVLLLPGGAETDRAIRLSEIGTLNQKCASILYRIWREQRGHKIQN